MSHFSNNCGYFCPTEQKSKKKTLSVKLLSVISPNDLSSKNFIPEKKMCENQKFHTIICSPDHS